MHIEGCGVFSLDHSLDPVQAAGHVGRTIVSLAAQIGDVDTFVPKKRHKGRSESLSRQICHLTNARKSSCSLSSSRYRTQRDICSVPEMSIVSSASKEKHFALLT